MNVEAQNKLFQYSFPTPIYFGNGARRQVVAILQEVGCSAPLIVTDKGISQLDICKDLVKLVVTSGLEARVFDEIEGNPVKSQVEMGVASYRSAGADCIIAFGGGAAMDVAKVIALMVHHEGDLFDYEDGIPNPAPVHNNIPTMIAIPTTAGTGSEVGRSSVISDDKTKEKKIIFSPRLLPNYVLVDPELTLKLPARMTAATGIDALTHLVEAYLAIGYHPMCDGIALEGIRLVAKNLQLCFEYAKRSPSDQVKHLMARGHMMNAAYMGAVAFQKGLGVNHSCAHALSTVYDMHHGLANGVMLNYCMEYNMSICDEKFKTMAMTVGLPPQAKAFINWINHLKETLEIPPTLADAGGKVTDIDRLVELSLKDVCHQSNPRPLSAQDFKVIFQHAFEGRSINA